MNNDLKYGQVHIWLENKERTTLTDMGIWLKTPDQCRELVERSDRKIIIEDFNGNKYEN